MILTALTAHVARLRFGAGTAPQASYLAPRDWPEPAPPPAFRIEPAGAGWRFCDARGTAQFHLEALGPGHLRLELLGEQHLYGLGHGGAGLDRLGTVRRLWNCHVNHGPGADIAVPLLLSNAGYGLFFDSVAPATLDPGPSADATYLDYRSDGPGLDLYLLAAGDLRRLPAEIAGLLGRAPLPPRWALGYLQSTRHFADAAELRGLAQAFRDRDLPLAALILLSSYGDMRGWNRGVGRLELQPDLLGDGAVLGELKRAGLRIVLHEYPVLHRDDPAHAEALQRGCLLDEGYPAVAPQSRPSANYHEGQRYLDFARPEVGAWWWARHRDLLPLADGWWLDGGEGPPGQPGHNRYDLDRQQAFAAGEAADRPGRRPFLLCRSGGPGMQRFGSACWSGDVNASFAALEAQIALGLNAGLSGIPYWGTDIGGYYPTREDSDELFVRWFQFGAFCPIFRAHGRNWRRHTPFGRGPAVEAICRRYLDLRQALMPYTYTLAWQAYQTGLPLMRPLVLSDPGDPRFWDLGTQYLWGDDLLVAPVTREGATAWPVTLPPGGWVDFWTHERHQGPGAVTVPAPLDRLPLLVREGAILPMRQRPGTSTFRIYPAAGQAVFTLYEDDGETEAYQAGAFRLTRVRAAVSPTEIAIAVAPPLAGAVALEVLLAEPPGAVAPDVAWRHDGTFLHLPLPASGAVRIRL